MGSDFCTFSSTELYFLGILLKYKSLQLPVIARWIIVGFTCRALKWPTALKQPRRWFLKWPHCLQCGMWWIAAWYVSVLALLFFFHKMLIYNLKCTLYMHTLSGTMWARKGVINKERKRAKIGKEGQLNDHRKTASDSEV